MKKEARRKQEKHKKQEQKILQKNGLDNPITRLIKDCNFAGLRALEKDDPVFFKEILNQSDAMGSTSMHHAAWHGSTRLLDFLIRKGADIHAKNSRAHLPIEFAIETGGRNKVRAFLRHKAVLTPEIAKEALKRMSLRTPNMAKEDVEKMVALTINTEKVSEDSDEEEHTYSSNAFVPSCQSCRAASRIMSEQNILSNILKAQLKQKEDEIDQLYIDHETEKKEIMDKWKKDSERLKKVAQNELQYAKKDMERKSQHFLGEENLKLTSTILQEKAQIREDVTKELREKLTKEFQDRFDKLARDNEYHVHVAETLKQQLADANALVEKASEVKLELRELQDQHAFAIQQKARALMQNLHTTRLYQSNTLLLKYMTFSKFLSEFKLKKRFLKSIEGWYSLTEELMEEEVAMYIEGEADQQSELESWRARSTQLLRLSRSRLKGYARRVGYKDCVEQICDTEGLMRTKLRQIIEKGKNAQKTNTGFSLRVSELTNYAMDKEKLIDSACKKVGEQILIIETLDKKNSDLRNHLKKAELFIKKLYDQMSGQRGGSKQSQRPMPFTTRPKSAAGGGGGLFLPGQGPQKSRNHRPKSALVRKIIQSPAPPASKNLGTSFSRKQKGFSGMGSDDSSDSANESDVKAYEQALMCLSEPRILPVQSGHTVESFPPRFVRGVDRSDFHQFDEVKTSELDARSKPTMNGKQGGKVAKRVPRTKRAQRSRPKATQDNTNLLWALLRETEKSVQQ